MTDQKNDDIKKSVVIKSIGSVVRHAVTALGAILVYKGITTPEVVGALASNVGELAMGIGIYFFGQIWSIVEKYLHIFDSQEEVVVVKPTDTVA